MLVNDRKSELSLLLLNSNCKAIVYKERRMTDLSFNSRYSWNSPFERNFKKGNNERKNFLVINLKIELSHCRFATTCSAKDEIPIFNLNISTVRLFTGS